MVVPSVCLGWLCPVATQLVQARPHAPPCIATGAIGTGGASRGETSRARISWHVVSPRAVVASVSGVAWCVVTHVAAVLGMLWGIGSHTRGRAPSTHPSRGLITHTLTAHYLQLPRTRTHQPRTRAYTHAHTVRMSPPPHTHARMHEPTRTPLTLAPMHELTRARTRTNNHTRARAHTQAGVVRTCVHGPLAEPRQTD